MQQRILTVVCDCDAVADVNECINGAEQCTHSCSNTAGSYICHCREGYQLLTDGVTCVDENECAGASHGCSQLCVNNMGHYSCDCHPGYELQTGDGSTCSG